jgi:hypothetical protein
LIVVNNLLVGNKTLRTKTPVVNYVPFCMHKKLIIFTNVFSESLKGIFPIPSRSHLNLQLENFLLEIGILQQGGPAIQVIFIFCHNNNLFSEKKSVK